MAYVITPHFIPAYEAPRCNPFGSCAPVSRPTYAYRTLARPQPRRPVYSPYTNFFSQVDELLGEIDREAQRQAHLQAQLEAQREAHRQRQQRKRALRAKFAVIPNEQGWQVDAEVTGFTQENISIEVTDENTLKVAGNTEWRSEPQAQPEAEAVPTPEEIAEESVVQTPDNRMDGVALNEPETETEPARSATPDSDTQSHRSYQATVEDDFEDLGAETSSLISNPSAQGQREGRRRVTQRGDSSHTTASTRSTCAATAESGAAGRASPAGFFRANLQIPRAHRCKQRQSQLQGWCPPYRRPESTNPASQEDCYLVVSDKDEMMRGRG